MAAPRLAADTLDPWLRALLAQPRAVESLRGSALLAIAFWFSRARSLDVERAIDVLVEQGLSEPEDRARLVDRLRQSGRADPSFELGGDRFRPWSMRTIEQRMLLIRESIEVSEPALAQSVRRALLGAMPTPFSAVRVVERRTLDLFDRDVGVDRAREPRSSPGPAPPAPPAVVAFAWPEPAALEAALPSVVPLDPAALRELLAAPLVPVARVRHVLEAHALACAGSFDELLAPATLVGVTAFRHQIEAARRVLRALGGRALLSDEVGLGKTIEAILVLREYQLRSMVRRALVLCPPALVGQWCGELEARAGVVARTSESPEARSRPEEFWRREGVVVASLAAARTQRTAGSVQAEPWDLVVVDEAHHVKNRSSAGWKLVDGLRTRFLLLVTATPIETDLDEIYNLVTLLRPGQLPSPGAFRKQFVDPDDPGSPRNKERLRALLSEVMVRNTRARSGLRLPPRYVTTVLAEPLEAEASLHRGVLELLRAHGAEAGVRLPAAALVLEAASSPLAARRTLERMLAGDRHQALREPLAELEALAARAGGTRKTEMLVEIVRAHAEPVLVFARFRATLEEASGALARAGIAHVQFHGGLAAAEKRAAVEEFRQGARVMLATDVGAEGQNLQFASCLVNLDLPWNPMLIEQRIGRLHRIGQEREVRVFNLALRGTIDERVLDVLDRRLHLFELVVGEMDMVLGNLADDRDLEERILALCASVSTEEDLARGFDEIAADLGHARSRYERTRALDAALLGEDFEA